MGKILFDCNIEFQKLNSILQHCINSERALESLESKIAHHQEHAEEHAKDIVENENPIPSYSSIKSNKNNNYSPNKGNTNEEDSSSENAIIL